jgi:hypothetical protein
MYRVPAAIDTFILTCTFNSRSIRSSKLETVLSSPQSTFTPAGFRVSKLLSPQTSFLQGPCILFSTCLLPNILVIAYYNANRPSQQLFDAARRWESRTTGSTGVPILPQARPDGHIVSFTVQTAPSSRFTVTSKPRRSAPHTRDPITYYFNQDLSIGRHVLDRSPDIPSPQRLTICGGLQP